MRALFRRAVFLSILALAAGVATSAMAERRVALVIGIGAYENLSALANPTKDAHAIAAALRGYGFEVAEHYDLARGDFLNVLEDFERISDQADVAMIYYAGHGMEVAGENVLAPIDTQVSCEPKQTRRAVAVTELFEIVEIFERYGFIWGGKWYHYDTITIRCISSTGRSSFSPPVCGRRDCERQGRRAAGVGKERANGAGAAGLAIGRLIA